MTPHELLEHLFTNANPDTGSPPPAHVAWVVFENGTAFYTFPNDSLPVDASRSALVAAANGALDALGPVQVGTPSADFNAHRLASWLPNNVVYLVSFGSPDIAVVVTDAASDLAAGLEGRGRRQVDFEQRRVLKVRAFDGGVT